MAATPATPVAERLVGTQIVSTSIASALNADQPQVRMTAGEEWGRDFQDTTMFSLKEKEITISWWRAPGSTHRLGWRAHVTGQECPHQNSGRGAGGSLPKTLAQGFRHDPSRRPGDVCPGDHWRCARSDGFTGQPLCRHHRRCRFLSFCSRRSPPPLSLPPPPPSCIQPGIPTYTAC